jgi:hypothetical protein
MTTLAPFDYKLVDYGVVNRKRKKITRLNHHTPWSELLERLNEIERSRALSAMATNALKWRDNGVYRFVLGHVLPSDVCALTAKEATPIITLTARVEGKAAALVLAMDHPQRDFAMICACFAFDRDKPASLLEFATELESVDGLGSLLQSKDKADFVRAIRGQVNSYDDWGALTAVSQRLGLFVDLEDVHGKQVCVYLLLTIMWRIDDPLERADAAATVLGLFPDDLSVKFVAFAVGATGAPAPESCESVGEDLAVALTALAHASEDDTERKNWAVATMEQLLDDVVLGEFVVREEDGVLKFDLHRFNTEAGDIVLLLLCARVMRTLRSGRVTVVHGSGNHVNSNSRRCALKDGVRAMFDGCYTDDENKVAEIVVDIDKAANEGRLEAVGVLHAIHVAVSKRLAAPTW